MGAYRRKRSFSRSRFPLGGRTERALRSQRCLCHPQLPGQLRGAARAWRGRPPPWARSSPLSAAAPPPLPAFPSAPPSRPPARRMRGGGGGAMGLLEQCEAAFGAADLYRALGVRRGASPEEIRRGYHRASLRVHPDRVPPDDKEEATRRFQILGKAYAVLSDAEQRALYDEQGRVDEEGEALRAERDWQEYWRLLFKKISVKDIEDFEKTYKDSEQELADIKAAYVDFEGDMDKIMESVLCVDYTDEPRIRKIIEKAIDCKEVPSYKAFIKEPKQKAMARKRRAEKEAREAEECKQELGLGDGEDDLKALIQSRNKDRKKEMDDFLSHLEAKYGNNPKKGGKKTAAKKGKK